MGELCRASPRRKARVHGGAPSASQILAWECGQGLAEDGNQGSVMANHCGFSQSNIARKHHRGAQSQLWFQARHFHEGKGAACGCRCWEAPSDHDIVSWKIIARSLTRSGQLHLLDSTRNLELNGWLISSGCAHCHWGQNLELRAEMESVWKYRNIWGAGWKSSSSWTWNLSPVFKEPPRNGAVRPDLQHGTSCLRALPMIFKFIAA